MPRLTRETAGSSRPKLARQWLSGVAGALLLASAGLPLWDRDAAGADTIWAARASALVLGLVMLSLFMWNPRQDRRSGMAIGVIGVVLMGVALVSLWDMGWAPALLLCSVALSVFVWNLQRPWVVGLAVGALLIWVSLTASWLFWNGAHGGPSDMSDQFMPRIGYFVYWAGLGATAISGVVYAFPERQQN